MTKEQEAIERCKSIVRVNKDFLKGNKQTINQKEIDCIETVLNMLKQNSAEIQQKNTEIAEKSAEIEELKQVLARNIAKNFTSSMKESAKSKEDLEMLNKGWQIELEKKEKITDLMAEEIEKGEIEFTEYCNFKIVCDRNCKGCIKQYFERKSEE